jgi:uncharacterized protein (TIRG00374 family)
MPQKSRRYFFLLVAILAIGILLYKFRNAITLQGFDWSAVGQSLRQSRLPLLLIALVAIYACYAIRAARWVRFCRWLGSAHFAKVYAATLMGFSCTFLLGRPGEPIRPVLIGRKDSLSIPQMFGIYVLERLFDIAATVIIAILALMLFQRAPSAGQASVLVMKTARSAGIVLSAGLVCAIAFLVYFRYHGAAWLATKLKAPKWRVGWREKIVVLLQGFSEGLQGIRTWGDLSSATLYTAAHWILVVVVYWLIVRSFPGSLSALSLGGLILVVAFTLVGSAAQLPVAGGGSQAATFLVLTLIFGVEKEPAAVASIIIWLVTFASCCLVGVPLLLREGWSMGELRKLARTEERAEEAQLLSDAEQGKPLNERAQ